MIVNKISFKDIKVDVCVDDISRKNRGSKDFISLAHITKHFKVYDLEIAVVRTTIKEQ